MNTDHADVVPLVLQTLTICVICRAQVMPASYAEYVRELAAQDKRGY